MKKTFLVRHGQDTANAEGILNGRTDTELTDLGRQQASEVAHKLEGRGIEIIYASPLKRAFQTARIIADHLGIAEVTVDENLIEREYGIMTGKRIADIPEHAAVIRTIGEVTYFIEAEGVEGYPDLLTRAKGFLEKARKEHPGRSILIVTHAAIGRMVKAAHYGWSWEQALEDPRFPNGEVFELG